MPGPIVQRITLYRGADTDIGATRHSSSASDITGWALAFYLYPLAADSPPARKDPDAAAVVTVTTAGGGISITGGPAGAYTVTLTAAAMSAEDVESGVSYWFEVWRTDSGDTRPLAVGEAVVH